MTTTTLQPLTFEIMKAKLPSRVTLHYVDYNDNLNDHPDLLQDYIRGGDLLEDKICEWYMDDFEELDYIKSELSNDLKNLGYSEEQIEEAFEEFGDDLHDAIRDLDDSNVVKGLLDNTTEFAMYYDTGAYVDFDWNYQTKEQMRDCLKLIKKTLGILQKDCTHDDVIQTNIQDGRLVLYFNGDYETIRKAVLDGTNTISFEYPIIGIIDTDQGGGGHAEYISSVTLPFDKSNLFIDDTDGEFSYVKNVCGMKNDFCESVKMTLSKTKTKKRAIESNNNYNQAIENKYIQVYKNGGCSFGDVNMRRHRNTPYINNPPCGNRCKDCGRFWID